jgi:hypothetical protein
MVSLLRASIFGTNGRARTHLPKRLARTEKAALEEEFQRELYLSRIVRIVAC